MAKPGSGSGSKRPGDTFARPAAESLIPTFVPRKLVPSRPGFTLADLKGETDRQFAKGFTTNHELQLIAGRYCQSPADTESRDLLLYYLGPYYETRIGYEGKEFLSSSHWGHYGASYGPVLHAALRAGDWEVVQLVSRVLKRLLAAVRVFAYWNPNLGQWRIVAPCSRVHLAPQEHADQRVEMVSTFEWLAAGTLPRQLPNWARKALALYPSDSLQVPPSILGLYALVQIQRAFERDLPWAREWPSVIQEIRSGQYPQDLPPVAYSLTVTRSATEHRGDIYLSTGKLRNAALQVYANYDTGVELYDWPEGKFSIPKIPNATIYKFPIVGR